jgi:hypothetical protein
LLAGFGPALGGLSQATQFLMKGVGGLVAGIAQVPALTGAAIGGILAGKFLFGKAEQIGIIAAGTSLGTKGLGGTLSQMGLGKGGRLGGAARFGATRLLPGLGAAIGVGTSAGQLMNKDKSDDAAGIGGLVGAGLGGLLGLIGGPGGALLGAGLGSMAGQFIGGMFGGPKAFGGGMDAGKTYLTGERGPELITAGTKSTVTANADLKSTFDTTALETKMASLVSEMSSANKTLTNMVNGVNTLVAIEGRSLKAVETTARKDRNQVGLV